MYDNVQKHATSTNKPRAQPTDVVDNLVMIMVCSFFSHRYQYQCSLLFQRQHFVLSTFIILRLVARHYRHFSTSISIQVYILQRLILFRLFYNRIILAVAFTPTNHCLFSTSDDKLPFTIHIRKKKKFLHYNTMLPLLLTSFPVHLYENRTRLKREVRTPLSLLFGRDGLNRYQHQSAHTLTTSNIKQIATSRTGKVFFFRYSDPQSIAIWLWQNQSSFLCVQVVFAVTNVLISLCLFASQSVVETLRGKKGS